MPSISGRLVADLLRFAAFAGALVAAAVATWADALRFVLIGLLLLALRRVDAPPPAHIAFAAAALFATVANVLDWYKYVSWIDTLIHALTTGTGAALASIALLGVAVGAAGDSRGLSRSLRLLFTGGIGAIGAIVWEFYEWTYEQIWPNSMTVGYVDTLADLAAGLGGSVVAGLLLGWWLRWDD